MNRTPRSVKRIPRDPLRYEILSAYDWHGRTESVAIHETKSVESFIAGVRQAVESALANEALLQGVRTQGLFEALTVSLGHVLLIKREDTHDIHAVDDRLEVPDFRAVLPDESQLLIEVKNHYSRTAPYKPFRLTKAYYAGLERYGQIMRCPVRVGVYWSAWNIWTLVPLSAFEASGRHVILTLDSAAKANEMATLGDVLVGTRFPLRCRFVTDPSKPRQLDSEGRVQFTIGGVEFYCGQALLSDPTEQRIALLLMLHGDWDEEATADIDGQTLQAVDHIFMPSEDHNQGFEFVGQLSGMFSRMFRFATSAENQVSGLGMDVEGGSWGRLIPADYKSKKLPLWRLVQQPTSPRKSATASPKGSRRRRRPRRATGKA